MTLSQSAVYSIFLQTAQIFQTIACQVCNQILTFIFGNHTFCQFKFNSLRVSCCFKADKQA